MTPQDTTDLSENEQTVSRRLWGTCVQEGPRLPGTCPPGWGIGAPRPRLGPRAGLFPQHGRRPLARQRWSGPGQPGAPEAQPTWGGPRDLVSGTLAGGLRPRESPGAAPHTCCRGRARSGLPSSNRGRGQGTGRPSGRLPSLPQQPAQVDRSRRVSVPASAHGKRALALHRCRGVCPPPPRPASGPGLPK